MVREVSGTVLVAVPAGAVIAGKGRTSQKGLKFVPISQVRSIPVGSFLDTRRGTVRLSSAVNSGGKTQSGDFGSGLFQVLQSKKRSAKGLTDLVLKGSSFRRCGRASSGRAQASGSRRTIRRLRANARGRFRTRGRHSAATVRGTKWTTIDRCDGTLTTVSPRQRQRPRLPPPQDDRRQGRQELPRQGAAVRALVGHRQRGAR